MSRARTVQVGDDITRYVAQNSAEIPIEQLEVYCCARRGLTMGEICAELGRTGIDVVAALSELSAAAETTTGHVQTVSATGELRRSWLRVLHPGHRRRQNQNRVGKAPRGAPARVADRVAGSAADRGCDARRPLRRARSAQEVGAAPRVWRMVLSCTTTARLH